MNKNKAKLIFIIIVVLSACTREIPETEKKQTKNAEESAIRATFENWAISYNSGDLESALDFYENDYRGMLADSNDIIGKEALAHDLNQFLKQYPKGNWQLKIDEVSVSGELAYVIYSGNFSINDRAGNLSNPIYSERGIKILKRSKMGGWKIYRSMSMPVFSYD